MNPVGVPGAGDPFEIHGYDTSAAVQTGAAPAVGGYQSAYAANPYSSYGRYPAPYAGGYVGYGSGVYGASAGYSPYGAGYGAGGAMVGGGHLGALAGSAQQAQAGGAAVLSGMQEAMQRFARVSGLMEEVLRHLHLLFNGVFGLGYSLGAFHDEARMWLAVKTGPAAFVMRLVAKLTRLWRLITIFLCSPLAGEFSPVSLVLQLLGVAPAEDGLAGRDNRFLSPPATPAVEPEAPREARGGPLLFRNDSSL